MPKDDDIPLREYLQRQLDDLRTMLDERHTTSTEAVKTALTEQQRALQVSVVSIDKRLDLLNELRVGVATKAEVEALEKLVNGLMSRLDRIEGKGVGLTAGWAMLIGAVGLISTLIAVYLTLKG
jgi:uncharacterized membrane protein